MPNDAKGKESEKRRRFLAANYGEKESKLDETMTEEEWLLKEHKEIEEIEKTVTIRFANYSVLMRAQQLTAGLNAQLQMFLSTMGKEGGKPDDDQEGKTGLTKRLLESAGITDINIKADGLASIKPASPNKLRSLSPSMTSPIA